MRPVHSVIRKGIVLKEVPECPLNPLYFNGQLDIALVTTAVDHDALLPLLGVVRLQSACDASVIATTMLTRSQRPYWKEFALFALNEPGMTWMPAIVQNLLLFADVAYQETIARMDDIRAAMQRLGLDHDVEATIKYAKKWKPDQNAALLVLQVGRSTELVDYFVKFFIENWKDEEEDFFMSLLALDIVFSAQQLDSIRRAASKLVNRIDYAEYYADKQAIAGEDSIGKGRALEDLEKNPPTVTVRRSPRVMQRIDEMLSAGHSSPPPTELKGHNPEA